MSELDALDPELVVWLTLLVSDELWYFPATDRESAWEVELVSEDPLDDAAEVGFEELGITGPRAFGAR